MTKAYKDYKENFYVISMGIVIAGIIAVVLGYLAKLLYPIDLTTVLLLSSFFLAGGYVAARYAVKEMDTREGVEMMARFILMYSVFVLLEVAAVVSPYPFNVLIGIAVVSLVYMAVPVVAELGFKEGCEKIKKLIAKAPVTYVGLNLLFVMGLLAIVSIAVTPVLAAIALIVIAFFYLPLYYLTGYYLAHSTVR